MSEKFFGKGAAVWLCAGILFGFAGIALLAWRDKAHRTAIEQIAEPSAVGDTAYFQPREKIEMGKPLAALNGRQLFPVAVEIVSRRDSRMRKTEMDDSKSFFIYASENGEDEPVRGSVDFLKIAPGSYIMARVETAK